MNKASLVKHKKDASKPFNISACLHMQSSLISSRHLLVGDLVGDVRATRNALQVEPALVDGGADLPAVVAVDSQVCVDVGFVVQDTLDAGGADGGVQMHQLLLVGEVLVVDADDVPGVGLRVCGTHFGRADLAVEHGSGDALPGVVHLEARVQVHQPLAVEHSVIERQLSDAVEADAAPALQQRLPVVLQPLHVSAVTTVLRPAHRDPAHRAAGPVTTDLRGPVGLQPAAELGAGRLAGVEDDPGVHVGGHSLSGIVLGREMLVLRHNEPL